MAEIQKTKLILSADEAEKYVKYITGFAKSVLGPITTDPDGKQTDEFRVYLGLGNADGGFFNEIVATTANNYARVLVKRTDDDEFPNLLSHSGRIVQNHEQIVFNKVKDTAYTANAIGLYRSVSGGSPYAWAKLTSPLDAVVGSLPMFEREQLKLEIPDGTETN